MATKTKMTTTKAAPRKGGRPSEGLDRMMSIRVATDDVERLWSVSASIGQKHQAVARVALRIGLAALERTPAAFLGEDALQRPPKAKRKATKGAE